MNEAVKKRLRIVVPLGLILVAVLVGFMLFRNGRKDGEIRVSGNIEATEARLGFRIPGRIESRLVDEGDAVKKGDVLAVLESSDQKAAFQKASASASYSEAVVRELSNGSRPEDVDKARSRTLQARYALEELRKGSRSQDIERARAELRRAEAGLNSADSQLAQARSDVQRFEALYRDEGISQREYEQYKTRFETAESQRREAQAKVATAGEMLSLSIEGPRREEIKRAEAALKQAQADYALVKKGPRQETLDQAKAQLKVATASLEQAKLQLDYTKLIAPMDGIVMSKAVEIGEYVNPGSTAFVVGDLAHPWLRAYIHENDLGRVKLGAQADVTTDAYKDKTYKGRVVYISSQAEFTPKSVQTFEERVKLMFRIKIELENKDNELKPGMPGDALIEGP